MNDDDLYLEYNREVLHLPHEVALNIKKEMIKTLGFERYRCSVQANAALQELLKCFPFSVINDFTDWIVRKTNSIAVKINKW